MGRSWNLPEAILNEAPIRQQVASAEPRNRVKIA